MKYMLKEKEKKNETDRLIVYHSNTGKQIRIA